MRYVYRRRGRDRTERIQKGNRRRLPFHYCVDGGVDRTKAARAREQLSEGLLVVPLKVTQHMLVKGVCVQLDLYAGQI